ncbi:hypothetical protein ACP70R_026555 [Stipagrostis hirtigluma subsp. patula]
MSRDQLEPKAIVSTSFSVFVRSRRVVHTGDLFLIRKAVQFSLQIPPPERVASTLQSPSPFAPLVGLVVVCFDPMAPNLSSGVQLASKDTALFPFKPKHQEVKPATAAAGDVEAAAGGHQGRRVDYMARAQWLRAAVLGANDGLVSVASLMIGVGAVNDAAGAMLVSGLAGLVAGACSMAIGEFVSVYAQYDIQVAHAERSRSGGDDSGSSTSSEEESLPRPTQAAAASALAFAAGGALPLLAGGFVRPWAARVAAVCAASSLGLAGFGAAGAYLGGASVVRSGARVLLGGWLAMAVTYGVLKLFSLAFKVHVSSV